MNLTRLAEAGDLIRLAHGVYKDAGTPSIEHEELTVAWLSTEPKKLAYERASDRPGSVVISGESAAVLHGIGDFWAGKHEFTTRTRRQTQRPNLKYRTRELPSEDVTLRHGLPVTTRERTIADLVEDRHDLSLVANALRDAAQQSTLNVARLIELLDPLAERNGYTKDDGEEFLNDLLQIAGIDLDSLAHQAAAIPEFGARITQIYMKQLTILEAEIMYSASVQQLQLIKSASALLNIGTTDFVLQSAAARAEQVITAVRPSVFLDED